MAALTRTLAPVRLVAAAALLGVVALAPTGSAQLQMPRPLASPTASVSQTVGVTDVEVVYHRPAVKGRTIWGELIPYGGIWRAGANQNTTIEFGTDVTVEGQPLGAGKYGLHMIPGEASWTIIFSHDNDKWGSLQYVEDNDALRVDVVPTIAPMQERLLFDFDLLDDDSAHVTLRWDELAVPVRLDTDPSSVLAQAADSRLRKLSPDADGWLEAAEWGLQNGVDKQLVLSWADEAVAQRKTFTSLGLKAEVLDSLGRGEEAMPLKQEAWTVATEGEITGMAQQLESAGASSDALRLYQLNVRNHPESWRAHDRLGQALVTAGDAAAARSAFTQALALAGDDESRERIETRLADLGEG